MEDLHWSLTHLQGHCFTFGNKYTDTECLGAIYDWLQENAPKSNIVSISLESYGEGVRSFTLVYE